MRWLLAFLITFLLHLPSPSAAARLTPGNVIVTYLNDQVLEYSPTGDFVQAISLPGPVAEARGVVTDGSRLLHVWNRPFDALLATYDPGTGAWVNHTYPGWSSINCIPCNGIDALDPYVFVNDMDTFQKEERGLVRFNTADYSAQRFGEDQDYSDVTVGQNGRVYARRTDPVDPPPPTVIDTYNPITMSRLDTVTLAVRTLTITVDEDGDIFGCAGDSVNQYDSAGNVVASYPVVGGDEGALYDIDLSADGRFVLTTGNGWILLTDRAFQRTGAFRGLNRHAYATVIEGNRAPSANVGGPYFGTADVPMAFDGSESTDPDGDSLSFSWDFGDGMTGSGESPSHTYAEADSYLVVLTVSDGMAEASDSTVVRTAYRTTIAGIVAPNPVRGSATLTFHTARRGRIKVDVFDVTGRLIRTVVNEPQADPGAHMIPLEGRDSSGEPMSSGVYYYSIVAPGQSAQGRFTILR